MAARRAEQLAALQKGTASVRNICVLAHVDHGKTSLSDCLVSSNGIISERLAGTVRYLDSREDEQERGITMQSSAISLLFRHDRLNKEYLINLIDSPGHVDFSSDVSTAVRLCDGALVVVDVIEGVAIQTHAVLRQAWEERLQPCLVLNKVDLLITKLQLDPVEAYEHLNKIIERVNAILQGFVSASLMDEADQRREAAVARGEDAGEEHEFGLEFDDAQEAALIFSPEKGNVAFASATDSWAFRIIDFAPMVAEKLQLPVKQVVQALWGHNTYNAKTNKIVTHKQLQASVTTGQASRSRPPMFATFILQSIWEVYGATVLESKPKRLEKIISMLGLDAKVPKRDLARSGKSALRAVMHAWLPVSRALLAMVVRWVPGPARAQARRVEVLWPKALSRRSPQLEDQLAPVREAVARCDPAGPVVAFVTKIFAVERKLLPQETIRRLEALAVERDAAEAAKDGSEAEAALVAPTSNMSLDENGTQQEFFFAFARIFSGTIRPGQPVYVLGPKYVPGVDERRHHATLVKTGVLPMLIMSTELVALSEVPAGNVLAIAGLERDVLKTATLCDSAMCCSLSKMPSQSAPILRVSLEPSNPLQWPELTKGLRLLNRADPVAEVRILPNGEHVLGAIGELHLERCVKDLVERFAKIELKVSKPIAIFRETLVRWSPEELKILPPLPPHVLDPICIADELHQHQSHQTSVAAGSAGESDVGVQPPTPPPAGGYTPDSADPQPAPQVPLHKRVFPGGRVIAAIAGNNVAVVLRTLPLPDSVVRVLENQRASIQKLVEAAEDQNGSDDDDEDEDGNVTGGARSVLDQIARNASRRSSRRASRRDEPAAADAEAATEEAARRESLEALRVEVRKELSVAMEQAGPGWAALLDRLWSLGPRGVGCNMLLNMQTSGPIASRSFDPLQSPDQIAEADEAAAEAEESEGFHQIWDDVASGIVAGFQLACRSGPVCEEPLWGTAIIVDQVSINTDDAASVAALRQRKQASLAGQVMSTVREAVRRAFSVHHLQHEHGVQTGCQVRLVEGFLRCLLQCHVESHQGDQLGRMYSVLSKRRAKVVSEDMWEGTSIFTIEALIPVVESFRLGDDLRRQTSGAASTPQLVFSHWKVLEENPFFRATTEDELEEFGETGYEESYLAHNIAHKYVQEVRKRKGLATTEKVVVAAEKQRTLAKKK